MAINFMVEIFLLVDDLALGFQNSTASHTYTNNFLMKSPPYLISEFEINFRN